MVNCGSFVIFKPGLDEHLPVRVDRNILAKINKNEVFIQKWQPPLRYKYFKHIMPEVPITMCNSCFRVSCLQMPHMIVNKSPISIQGIAQWLDMPNTRCANELLTQPLAPTTPNTPRS